MKCKSKGKSEARYLCFVKVQQNVRVVLSNYLRKTKRRIMKLKVLRINNKVRIKESKEKQYHP